MKRLLEIKSHASFTFGRFNPPTTGHEKLIQALAKQGGDMFVYPSHSQDAKKNPLPHPRKIAYMKKMFPKYARNIIASKSKNVFQIATDLYDKGYSSIIMVVGSDRVQEFKTLLKKYNGVKGIHGFYDFKNIDVVSAGDRDPDAEGVSGMSASKMRTAAVDNDFNSFSQGLPKNFKDGKKLFDDIRKAMNVNETNWSTDEILRDLYIRGEIFNINEEVTTDSGLVGKVVRKGTNYLVLETNDGLKKVWLNELIGLLRYAPKAANWASKVDLTKVGTAVATATTGLSKAKDWVKSKVSSKKKPQKPQKSGPMKFHTKKEEDEKEKPQSDTMKDRDALKDLQKKKKLAQLQLRIAQDQERVAKLNQQEGDVKIPLELLKLYNLGMKLPAGSSKHKEVMKKIADLQKKYDIKERKLTDAEKDKMKKYEKDIDKKEFTDRYGKEEGEKIYYATITKMAKEERKRFISPRNLPNLKVPVKKKGRIIKTQPRNTDTDASKRGYQVAHKEVDEWYKDTKTRTLYKERYGPVEWLEKLNITYEKMLSKLDNKKEKQND